LVGKIGERERMGQHGRELCGVILQPSPQQPRWPLGLVGESCMPVEEVAQREQLAQIGRWRELHAGERGL